MFWFEIVSLSIANTSCKLAIKIGCRTIQASPRTVLKGELMAGSPVVQASNPDSGGLSRIDFAQLTKRHFLVYGWILGFTTLVDRASIDLGGVVIDLLKQAIPVRRPDVAQHFSLEAGNDKHGFYALIDGLSADGAVIDHIKLSVTLSSGETTESVWPVSFGDGRTASAIQPYAETLKGLLSHLPRPEAKRLVEFARPTLGPQAEADYLGTLPPPVRFAIDSCCILENRILVVSGWLFDPLKELSSVQLRVGESVFDLLENSESIPRPDLNFDSALFRKRDAAQLPGFMFVRAIRERDAEANEAWFVFTAGGVTAQLPQQVCNVPQEARRDFLSLLNKLDSDSVLALSERMGRVLDNCPEQRSLGTLLERIRHSAVEHLLPSIQHENPRYVLHIDQATLVAGNGVFLVGWFNMDFPAAVQIVCHCGSSSFVVSDHWVRYRRHDVSAHLANVGIVVSDHDHGYTCYVPLSHGDEPYYLAVVSESGEVRRMRVTVTAQQGTLQTVRALLNPFDSGKADLRILMERHIGPAVGAVWGARQKRSQTPVVCSYGARPSNPPVSVIVPLYGRYDFAEYQMALFADDPEFQRAELIYVVDDPAIVREFYARCADLYGIYQVPFVVTHPSSNLGFAGANNFAAEVARGRHLLLMNSDVMPRRAGWLGELLRIYQSLTMPGLLGVKLLYEDGSVQHAGMAFRRLAAWDNLWTNHHPSKGQSPTGLSGVLQVAAVTAACALVEAALYRELGGFSEDFIIGDFEDSDLCLRASLAGKRNYVALDIELYHLERQSQNTLGDVQWRTNITVYNCLLHNRRWADLIEKMSTGEA
jgi:GT2 family glycosyltransferase